ncbi:hypothetical protein CH292_09840 [Rhodococcus sp. 14-2470-1a]|nr:hypothetical protein CH292_09840 [Rhodococcus sp. 14-2470-1a]
MERQSGVGVQMPYQPNVRETNSNTRLSDAHRDAAVDLLTSHVASGRLTIEDFDGRAAQAYAAVTRADLDDVFRDLPAPVASTLVASTLIEPQSPQRPPMSRELLTWASVGVLCLTIWAVTSVATGNFLYPWPVWVIGPWGAMLALHRVTGMPMGCTSR